MPRRDLASRLERLKRLRPTKGRWVEPRINFPGGPALIWDPDPDRPCKLVIPKYDARFESEPEGDESEPEGD